MPKETAAAVKADPVVRLKHPVAAPPYVPTVLLTDGLQVAYGDHEPITYDGDVNKFTNAFAAQCHPARVKIDEWQHGTKKVTVEGNVVEVPVVQRTLRLLDG